MAALKKRMSDLEKQVDTRMEEFIFIKNIISRLRIFPRALVAFLRWQDNMRGEKPLSIGNEGMACQLISDVDRVLLTTGRT